MAGGTVRMREEEKAHEGQREGREGQGRQGKAREGKAREGKGKEGKEKGKEPLSDQGK